MPTFPSSLLGVIGPCGEADYTQMERQEWGAALDPSTNDEKITFLSYADDITLIAETAEQAGHMLEGLAQAFQGINLQLLAP